MKKWRFIYHVTIHISKTAFEEMKNRALVVTGLTMLAYSHMPLIYWVKAFLIANTISNNMSFVILNNAISFEFYLKRKLTTYGSRFLDVHVIHISKITRSINWIFIQVSVCAQHRGYKCLHNFE